MHMPTLKRQRQHASPRSHHRQRRHPTKRARRSTASRRRGVVQARRRAVVSLVRGMIRRRRGGDPQQFASLKVENTPGQTWDSAGDIFNNIQTQLQQTSDAQPVVLNDITIKDGHQKVIDSPLKQALPGNTVFYTGVSRKFPDRQYMVVNPKQSTTPDTA